MIESIALLREIGVDLIQQTILVTAVVLSLLVRSVAYAIATAGPELRNWRDRGNTKPRTPPDDPFNDSQ